MNCLIVRIFWLWILIFARPSTAAMNSFIYIGCSQLKYAPGSPYESGVNSILTSVVNAAAFSGYNTFKFPFPASSAVSGLYQCRGDLSGSICHDCVSEAVSRLGSSCVGAAGGAMQLEGCFVRYDNATFVGVEDKTVVTDKCGPPIDGGDESGVLTGKDGVLAYLMAGGQYFRVGGSGKVQGLAQCVQDLSISECQDCISEAIQRLKNECGSSAWGDMFLGKCYARYSERGYTAKHDENDDEMEKTLAIFIGLVAGVAVLIVFLSVLSKLLDRKGGSSGK
ncbi:plasmodesmata-located protein 6-like [Andrographis paniculata]|uniref:plasmodesmata-located protein 6-like n=1 Tax=Andrographis paniculata TaxID=175694 RepID=UPI0021E78F7D|nr:plasmodesmata-located protein 6-like [Andrographis paniculata]